MRALEFIRDHVTFKLPYDFSYQMKTSNVWQSVFSYLQHYAKIKTSIQFQNFLSLLTKKDPPFFLCMEEFWLHFTPFSFSTAWSDSSLSNEKRAAYMKGRGGDTVFWMGFYADIALESRCRSEIKVWGHLCQILVVFEVPAQPRVKGMSGNS